MFPGVSAQSAYTVPGIYTEPTKVYSYKWNRVFDVSRHFGGFPWRLNLETSSLVCTYILYSWEKKGRTFCAISILEPANSDQKAGGGATGDKDKGWGKDFRLGYFSNVGADNDPPHRDLVVSLATITT